MQISTIRKIGLGLGASLMAASLVLAPASALQTASSSSSSTRLSLIINRGNNEISRRLTTLNTLSSKISSAAKLTDSDKSALTSEVSSEVSGLTALKTKLDAETTVDAAVTDAQSIISEYHVYVFVVPQVNLVKTADDQQAAEAKLSDLATKLASRLSSVTNEPSLQAALTDMQNKVSAAQGVSSSVETAVLALTPSNYTAGELGSYRDQLKTAQADNQAAVSDAKTIINGLKTE